MVVGQTLPLSVMVFILSLNFQNVSGMVNTGDWISREGPRSREIAFRYRTTAWNSTRTDEFCSKSAYLVELDQGTQDYSAIINQAVPLMHSKGGGTVYLGLGEYIVSGPIEMLSGTCIFGKDDIILLSN